MGLYALCVHYWSFGCNSLLDTAMGYDVKDPSKQHHPLVSGRISLHVAHQVIHFGIMALAVAGIVLTLLVSPNPSMALACFSIYIVGGYAYNAGLDKESIFGFIPISVCFAALSGWAWFLTHETLTEVGKAIIGYVLLVILFQISYSGHLKEITVGERGNLLRKLGAKVENNRFDPGKGGLYGVAVKFASLYVAFCLMTYLYEIPIGVFAWFVVISALIIIWLRKLTKPRVYNRNKDLVNMSIMEVLSIYLIIPLVLGWATSAILMLFGIIYFFMMNVVLWGKPYPKV
jgi:4-hydroxybenzoate polyprenyltransferase